MVDTADHAPAHVHVIKDNATILIALESGKAYKVKRNPTDATVRAAEAVVAEHIEECRAEWKKWHG